MHVQNHAIAQEPQAPAPQDSDGCSLSFVTDSGDALAPCTCSSVPCLASIYLLSGTPPWHPLPTAAGFLCEEVNPLTPHPAPRQPELLPQ